jgi:hypothetical protein
MEKTPDSDDYSEDSTKTTGTGTGSYHGEQFYTPPPERPKQPLRQGMIFERMVHHDVGPGAPSETKPSGKSETDSSDEKEKKESKDKKKQPQWPTPYIPRVPLTEGHAVAGMPKSTKESAESAKTTDDSETDTNHTDVTPEAEVATSQEVPVAIEHATDAQPPKETGQEASRRVTDDNWSEWSAKMKPKPSEVLKRRIPGFPGPVAKAELPAIHTPDYAASTHAHTEASVSTAISHDGQLTLSGHEHPFEQPQETLFDTPLGPLPPEAHDTANTMPPTPDTGNTPIFPGNLPPSPNNPHFFNSDATPHFEHTALNPNVGSTPPAHIGNQAPETRIIEKGSGWGPALAVGLIERHFRRKEDKKLRKQNDKLFKLQTVNQESQQRMERAQNDINARMREQQQEIRRQPRPERIGGVPIPFGAIASPNSVPNANTYPVAGPNRPAAERFAHPVVAQEVKPQPAEAQTVEQAPDGIFGAEQPARIVQDAWRRYKVGKDNREMTPAEGFGQAFHEERKQEVLPDRTTATPPPPRQRSAYVAGAAPALGAFAAFGQAKPQPTYQPQPGQATLPSGMTTPSLPQGIPMQADPQHRLPATDKATSNSVPGVWFWVMLGIIIAAFFAAALI